MRGSTRLRCGPMGQAALVVLSCLAVMTSWVPVQARSGMRQRSLLQDSLRLTCVATPGDASCSAFEYPAANITADINNLCNAMLDMPGCSIQSACQAGTVNNTEYCNDFTILATLCVDMGSMPGCSTYNKLCSAGSVVPQCSAHPAIPGAPSWASSRDAVFGFCQAMPIQECATCTRLQCNAPLITLAALCREFPDQPSCTEMNEFCETAGVGGGFLAFCDDHTGHDHHHHDEGDLTAVCLADSTNTTCASFVYPNTSIAADLDSLCGDMPDMPACSVRTACEAGTVTNATYCEPFRLLATTCADMPTMTGCGNYTALCANGTAVEQCATMGPYEGLPGWSAARGSAFAFCTAQNVGECASCTQSACPDPLATLAALCREFPDQPSCTDLNEFCETAGLGGGFLAFCDDHTGHDHHHHDEEGGASPTPETGTASLSVCEGTPSDPSCATFVYPADNITADITKLCASMPDMPGCAVNNACMSGQVSNGAACASFTILATICTDMPSMNGCQGYNALCKTGSTVPQCAEFPAISGLPTWSTSRAEVQSICTEMSMGGCSQCTATNCPDPLGTLAGLCLAMPSMSQCAAFNNWCMGSGAQLSLYCSPSSSLAVGQGMQMYFYNSWRSVILWQTWVTNNQGSYVGSVFAVLSFGVVSMVLKTVSAILGIGWKRSHSAGVVAHQRHWLLPQGSQLWHILARAFLFALATCLDYFNMLVAMTYNVGLFVAVVMGYVLGYLLTSHIPENYTAVRAARARAEADDLRATVEGVPTVAGKLAPDVERGCECGEDRAMRSSSSSQNSQAGAHTPAIACHMAAPACCPEP